LQKNTLMGRELAKLAKLAKDNDATTKFAAAFLRSLHSLQNTCSRHNDASMIGGLEKNASSQLENSLLCLCCSSCRRAPVDVCARRRMSAAGPAIVSDAACDSNSLFTAAPSGRLSAGLLLLADRLRGGHALSRQVESSPMLKSASLPQGNW
jgi:hypothetical protein